MAYIVLGLGNPGGEYKNTRHNFGREIVETFSLKNDFSEWKENKKAKSFECKGEVGGVKVVSLLTSVFMNESGKTAVNYVKSVKGAEKLIVVQDDIDLPLGSIKISFGRNSGGHRGIDSIMRSLKTKDFTRIRVGISPATSKGVAKKPKGEEAVIKHVLGKLKPAEQEIFKKVKKKAVEAIEIIVQDGLEKAMGEVN